jgi:hypothetical protein
MSGNVANPGKLPEIMRRRMGTETIESILG